MFFIASLYLVSSASLSNDEIDSYSFPLNHEYEKCGSNGAADITILSTSPNPYFCYQTTDYFINTTIISGSPILFFSHYHHPTFFQTFTFTGTNTSIGEYNTWNYTWGYNYCACGVSQHDIIIYDAITYEIGACMFLKFTLPCPQGDVGSLYANFKGFNLYSVKITPYPPLCKEQTIEVSGYLPGMQYNYSMDYIKVVQRLKLITYQYYYGYDNSSFNFKPFSLNNLTIVVPPPDLCNDDTAYIAYIYIYGEYLNAAWSYRVNATQKLKSSLIYLDYLTYLILLLII